MPHFGEASKRRIATLHPGLQVVMHRAILIMDFSVIDGLRDQESQEKAVAERRSKVSWPLSRHNRSQISKGVYTDTMSDAVDIVPYPVKWPDIQGQTTMEYAKRKGAFYRLAGIITTIAHDEGIKLRWGGDFKSFFDGPHFERVV